MEKQQPIDETAVRLGRAIRLARENCQLSIDAAAVLLRVLPMDLAEFEAGTAQIPADIMQRITVMGYKMMQARRFDRRYIKLRKMMAKIKQINKSESDNE